MIIHLSGSDSRADQTAQAERSKAQVMHSSVYDYQHNDKEEDLQGYPQNNP